MGPANICDLAFMVVELDGTEGLLVLQEKEISSQKAGERMRNGTHLP